MKDAEELDCLEVAIAVQTARCDCTQMRLYTDVAVRQPWPHSRHACMAAMSMQRALGQTEPQEPMQNVGKQAK